MHVSIAILDHCYQPWWQFPTVLRTISRQVYCPVWRRLAEDPRHRGTVNICLGLVELFQQLGLHEPLEVLQKLVYAPHIEITDTAAYHPIMPLVTPRQGAYQASLQSEMQTLFRGLTKPQGFFLPELGFSQDIVTIMTTRDYDWTVVDDRPFVAEYGFAPYNFIPAIEVPINTGYTSPSIPKSKKLAVFLRSSFWSFEMVANGYIDGRGLAHAIAQGLRSWTGGQDAYLVLCWDIETFNHHKQGYWDHCRERFVHTLEKENPFEGVWLELVTLSELLERFPLQVWEIPPGTWSTNIRDYHAGNYWPLWKDTSGGHTSYLHDILWRLYDLAENAPNHAGETYRELAKAASSCTWWHIPHGNPQLSLFGVRKFLEVIRAAGTEDQIAVARDLYEAFLKATRPTPTTGVEALASPPNLFPTINLIFHRYNILCILHPIIIVRVLNF